MEQFWQQFDAIYCINLVSRPDRKAKVDKVFAQVGLTDKVEFFFAEKDKENPVRGCYTSHQSVIRKSHQQGHQRILIFEDDIVFAPPQNGVWQEITHFLNYYQDWEIFFLGAVPEILNHSSSILKRYPHIRQMASICTHAYILNAKSIAKYQQMPFADVQIDYLYLSASKNAAFDVYPYLFYQGDSTSDTGGDEDVFIFKIKPLLIKMAQNYSQRINVPINTLAWIIVALLVIVLLYVWYTGRIREPLILLVLIVLIVLVLLLL